MYNVKVKKFSFVLFGALIAAITVYGVWHWVFPFGRKVGLLPNLWAGMSAYALAHGGWFPSSSQDPYQALAKLYPDYCSAVELAGISGDPKLLKETLDAHKEPNETLITWIYFPGLRRDDPENLAILWARMPGFYWNARRNGFGGRPVLFVNGSISNIPASSWDEFVKRQSVLRKSVLNVRTNVLDAPLKQGL